MQTVIPCYLAIKERWLPSRRFFIGPAFAALWRAGKLPLLALRRPALFH
jgi:hypothetical protein